MSGTYTYTLVGAWGMGWGGILRVGVGLRAWDFPTERALESTSPGPL